MKTNFLSGIILLSVLLPAACAERPLEVRQPAVLKADRYVAIENLKGRFKIEQSEAFRFFFGGFGRRDRRWNEIIQQDAAALDGRLRSFVISGLLLNGYSPVGAESARPPALIFRGTMEVSLVRGLFWDSTRVRFQGEMLTLTGSSVARGLVEESFLGAEPRSFADILARPLNRPVQTWFDALEKSYY